MNCKSTRPQAGLQIAFGINSAYQSASIPPNPRGRDDETTTCQLKLANRPPSESVVGKIDHATRTWHRPTEAKWILPQHGKLRHHCCWPSLVGASATRKKKKKRSYSGRFGVCGIAISTSTTSLPLPSACGDLCEENIFPRTLTALRFYRFLLEYVATTHRTTARNSATTMTPYTELVNVSVTTLPPHSVMSEPSRSSLNQPKANIDIRRRTEAVRRSF